VEVDGLAGDARPVRDVGDPDAVPPFLEQSPGGVEDALPGFRIAVGGALVVDIVSI